MTPEENHNFNCAEAAAGQGHWDEANYYILHNIFIRLLVLTKERER